MPRSPRIALSSAPWGPPRQEPRIAPGPRPNSCCATARGRPEGTGGRALGLGLGRRTPPLLCPTPAAGDGWRSGPRSRAPPAREQECSARTVGGGAALVYLRPRGRVTWAGWNARPIQAGPPRPAPPLGGRLVGVAEAGEAGTGLRTCAVTACGPEFLPPPPPPPSGLLAPGGCWSVGRAAVLRRGKGVGWSSAFLKRSRIRDGALP